MHAPNGSNPEDRLKKQPLLLRFRWGGSFLQLIHQRLGLLGGVDGIGRSLLRNIGSGLGIIGSFLRIDKNFGWIQLGGNRRRRPVHLFFGMRDPGSDFFYGEEMPGWQAQGQLTRLVTASSRGGAPRYVQEALQAEAAEIARLIRDGARVMVCGGRGMAAGVAETLSAILAPSGLSPAHLKAEGRYVEDVY